MNTGNIQLKAKSGVTTNAYSPAAETVSSQRGLLITQRDSDLDKRNENH